MNERKEFLSRIFALSELVKTAFPAFQLTETTLGLYETSLRSYGYLELSRAVEKIIFTRSSRDPFPSISEIAKLIKPEIDPESRSVQVAHRIWDAIGRFGWCNHKQALDWLGPDGEAVVRAGGGWIGICEDANSMNPGIMKAQLRDLARAVLSGEPSFPTLRLETNDEQQHGLSHLGADVFEIPHFHTSKRKDIIL